MSGGICNFTGLTLEIGESEMRQEHSGRNKREGRS
jgi:hypothetical protein